MAVDLNSYLNDKFGIQQKDIRTYSPLTLAYIGDAVFDIVVRSILVNKGNTPVNKLHQRASQVVKAQPVTGNLITRVYPLSCHRIPSHAERRAVVGTQHGVQHNADAHVL